MTADREVKRRMRERLTVLGWTLGALSSTTGDSYRNVRNWVSGPTRLPAHFVVRFLRTVPVDARWLLTGEGSPEPGSSSVDELASQLMQAALRISRDQRIPPASRRERMIAALRALEGSTTPEDGVR